MSSSGRMVGCLFVALAMVSSPAVASAQTVTLKGGTPPDVSSLRATHRLSAGKVLNLKIVMAVRNKDALDKLLAAQQDPKSLQYHHWLTPDEYAARFGPTQADFKAVVEWLKSEGFDIVSSNINDRYISVSGTVATVEVAFDVAIAASDDERFFANTADPRIPARFASIIAHVDGLDNLRHAVPGAVRRRDGRAAPDPQFTVKGVATGFGPHDLYRFYDEEPLLTAGIDGRGSGCLALVEDSDYSDASVALFDSTFGLRSASLSRVFPTLNPGKNGDEFETLLDIEYAHALAPAAAIRVYIGNHSNGVVNAIVNGIQKAVGENVCGSISISFFFCGVAPGFLTAVVDPLFAQAASQGQTVFVISGDSGAAGTVFDAGAGTCVPGTSRNINELSADPHVTSVGGTQFKANFDSNGNDVGFVPEQAWDEVPPSPTPAFFGASGGGASTVFAKPAYQEGSTPADGARDIPDLSIIASANQPGVFLGDDVSGRPLLDCCAGGTSLSAPLWGGISKLIAQIAGGRIGNLNARLYQLGVQEDSANVGLRDVTSGTNTFNGVAGFPAGPLYDQSTGWGTPDIAVFVDAFASGALLVSSRALDFAPSGVGTSPLTRRFTIENSAAGVLIGNVDTAALSPAFTAAGGGSFRLARGRSKPVVVRFAPVAAGTFNGSIIVNSSDPNNPSVDVSVSAIAYPGAISVLPQGLDFGAVRPGGQRNLILTVKNAGLGVLHGKIDTSALRAPFTASGGGRFRLTDGKSRWVRVRFAPTSNGPFSGAITVTSDDPANPPVVVAIMGVGA